MPSITPSKNMKNGWQLETKKFASNLKANFGAVNRKSRILPRTLLGICKVLVEERSLGKDPMPRHQTHCQRSYIHHFHITHTLSLANMELSHIVWTNANHSCRPPSNAPQKNPTNMAPCHPSPHPKIHSSPRDTLVQHVTRPATPLAQSLLCPP